MGIWRELAEVARWAPSSHNAQPWRLQALSELHAELCYEPACLLPAVDPEGRLTALALGGFTEALSIAGAPRSFEIRAALRGEQLWTATGPPVPIARLVVSQRRAPEPLARSLVTARRTSRLPFDGVAPGDAEVAGLAAIAAAAGHELTVSSAPDMVSATLDLYSAAVISYAETDRLRGETAGWLRRSDEAAARAGDGLSPNCLGPSGRQLLRLHRLSAFALLPGTTARARASVRNGLAGTAAIGWLDGPFTTLDERFGAGRMLCRLWLAATARGLYLQPLDACVSDGSVAGRLPEPVRQCRPWFLFRIGRGATPARSARLSADELFVGPSGRRAR